MPKIIIVTLIGFLLFPFDINITEAHPGRTREDGGHYCWTNCEEWGLKNGQYHYHDTALDIKKREEAKKKAREKARQEAKEE